MEYLSNKQLLDAYDKAVELNLNQDFIQLLEKEIKRRNIKYSDTSY